MILPHITVGQDVITELLSSPQAGTMSKHQPSVRAQHGNVISYGAGVGRAGANVDHGDTLKAGFDKMKGRHLGQALNSVSSRASSQALVTRDYITGRNEGVIAW